MYRKLASAELSESLHIRLVFCGRRTQQKLADAFIATVESGGDRETFRTHAINAGISPMLLIFILGVAWDLLLLFWERRNVT